MIPTVHRIAWSCLLSAAVSFGQGGAEGTVRVQILDNGQRAAAQAPYDTGGTEETRVPWWRSAPVSQPIPAYAPLLREIELRGTVIGAGEVVIRDGAGGEVAIGVDSDFVIDGEMLEASLGGKLTPRLVLELRSDPETPAQWRELEVWISLPCPDEKVLRAEILAHLGKIFSTWLERGRDDVGARKTTYICHGFDALTGERVMTVPGALSPLYEELLVANHCEPRDEWTAALELHLDEFLILGIYPHTGLPREWDCVADLPSDTKPVEIARYLDFLLDVSQIGPESHRERALAAALRMGETVLEKGVLPDRSLAVKYVPKTGEARLDVQDIRALDVAAQLARLGAMTGGDARFTDAARNAIRQLEYTHYWGGSWERIDPDFDDRFGNWAARAVLMMEHHPSEPVFANLVHEGFLHFEPIWADALRFGGSIAADQVRCWRTLGDYLRLRPDLEPRILPLLRSAARAHFKGEQFTNGAWSDLTFAAFDPKALPVGDFNGAPANLLEGLAYLYAPHLLRSEELRGMYTAVLRSSESAYKQRFGWLSERNVRQGTNLAYGDVRLLAGMVQMLERLTP